MSENVSFESAQTSLIMEPRHSNPAGNVHGGELLKIMDNIAGIVAHKHAKGNAVTARIDEIVFHCPINIGDIVTCTGQLTYVGTSSMQIMVTVHTLKNYSDTFIALTAFFTMVHLKDGKPSKVPPLKVTTCEEKDLYLLGERKYKEIKEKYM